MVASKRPKRSKAETRAVYVRRDQLARERGFKSYSDQRKQFQRARKARTFKAAIGDKKIRTNNAGDVANVRQWEETFYGPDRDDYSVFGPKARWFVDVLDQYTYDEWRDLYPGGVRETGLGVAA